MSIKLIQTKNAISLLSVFRCYYTKENTQKIFIKSQKKSPFIRTKNREIESNKIRINKDYQKVKFEILCLSFSNIKKKLYI